MFCLRNKERRTSSLHSVVHAGSTGGSHSSSVRRSLGTETMGGEQKSSDSGSQCDGCAALLCGGACIRSRTLLCGIGDRRESVLGEEELDKLLSERTQNLHRYR